ncbi:MAG: adenylyltransferase/cytidyltransferase family protein [bacterium]|nr:adenylyltransferase/cytidyltransferase family protein [bacterium]
MQTDKQTSVKRVMVFGVFDRLHPGHCSFLEQAATFGEELIVVVARDETVKQLKQKMPYQAEHERMYAVEQHPAVSRSILGDALLGAYEVIKNHKPDVICLGYDQKWLMQDLNNRIERGEIASVERIVMSSYEPYRFHTSLLTDV